MATGSFRPPSRNPLLVQPVNVVIGAAPATRRTQALRLAPFATLGLVALALPLVVDHRSLRPWWLLASGVLFAVTGLAVLFTPGPTTELWRRLPPVVIVCVAVMLLRQGSGAGQGYGASLILLPVMWQAIYGSRRDTTLAVAVAGASLVATPLLFDGYILRSELPRAVLLAVLAGVVGAVIQSLAHSLTATDDVLVQLQAIAQDLYVSDHPRTVLCAAIAHLTGAPVAVLVEPAEGRPTVTGSFGIDLGHRSGPAAATGEDADDGDAGPAPEVATPVGRTLALVSGSLVFEASPEPDPLLGITTPGSRLHLPIGPASAPTGVVTAIWPVVRHEPPALVLGALGMVGSDAGLALERQDLLAQLDDQAHRDGLTGLPNRRAWDELLAREIARARRSDRPLALAVLDLDNFKAYNDLHGHLHGDELLRSASSAWSGQLRSGDVLARWGGEEFAVLFPDSTAPEAAAVLQRLQAATPEGQSFSAGVCQYRPGDRAGSLMAAADQLMYEAKARGRDLILQRPELADEDAVPPIPIRRRHPT